MNLNMQVQPTFKKRLSSNTSRKEAKHKQTDSSQSFHHQGIADLSPDPSAIF